MKLVAPMAHLRELCQHTYVVDDFTLFLDLKHMKFKIHILILWFEIYQAENSILYIEPHSKKIATDNN